MPLGSLGRWTSQILPPMQTAVSRLVQRTQSHLSQSAVRNTRAKTTRDNELAINGRNEIVVGAVVLWRGCYVLQLQFDFFKVTEASEEVGFFSLRWQTIVRGCVGFRQGDKVRLSPFPTDVLCRGLRLGIKQMKRGKKGGSVFYFKRLLKCQNNRQKFKWLWFHKCRHWSKAPEKKHSFSVWICHLGWCWTSYELFWQYYDWWLPPTPLLNVPMCRFLLVEHLRM